MSEVKPEDICNQLVAKFSPSISRSMLLQATAQALGNASHNATFMQQQQNILINTSTATNTSIIQAVCATSAKT